MASSIVHLAITDELTRQLSFHDVNRLRFGALIPDAGTDYGKSHLKINDLEDGYRTYDFDRFRKLFGERMLTDDLYMGYYLHLVQDALYRHYVYDRYHWNPLIPGNLERLYKDYQIVNQYVIHKYSLGNNLSVPAGFEHEDLNQLTSFDTDRFMKELEHYFEPVNEEPIFFFTREMTDEFISEAVNYCVREVEKIRRGEPGIDMYEVAWKRPGQ